jgi:hypothetical protein
MTTDMTFNNKLSLFIPRIVPEWASQDLIVDKFKMLDIGTISRVDFLEKSSANGVTYYQAFLHFEMWEDNEATRNIQEKIYDSEQSARLIYDEPWYWILLKNHNPLTQEEVAANAALQQRVVALQQRVVALEQQIVHIQNNLIYWNNVTYRQINWHNNRLTPLWAHAVNTGMYEGEPAWLNNNETAPTMEQMTQQTAMMADDNDLDNESDNSSIPTLISDDDTFVQTPPNHITGGTPVTPEYNYTTTHYPFDDSVVIDLTNEFNIVG